MNKGQNARHYPAEHFLNRELSLLAFNRRVLAQAGDAGVPLLERLRFLCIVSANLDEFFEVRVAGLQEQVKLGVVAAGPDGLAPHETLRRIGAEAHELVDEQYALLYQVILPALEKQGIRFLKRGEWNEAQSAWLRDYFQRELMPVLTPIGLDPAHPFPRVLNKSLGFAVELAGKDAFGRSSGAAIVQAPRVLPMLVRLPPAVAGMPHDFVFLSSVLHAHVGELFAGMSVLGCYQFRVTRNSALWVDEEEVKNLRTALQGELPQRHYGDAVRLEVADSCSEAMADFLLQQFGLGHADLYRVSGIVNPVRLMQVPDLVDRPDLKYPPFQPGLPKALAKNCDVFAGARKQDLLLHHPFQSFAPVVDFLEQAADDPAVVAIKMTVYRTGTDSVLMDLLMRAARQGKEVTAVVELMARFDEEANISWAARLEEVGAHVVYGVFGFKTHAKMLMVVRREEGGEGGGILRRYVHLGTGNYHPRTARQYTDFGLISCNEALCADVNEAFKQLTGLGKASRLNHLLLAPFALHGAMLAAIRDEAANARAGKRVRIIAKMNALLEPEIIEALYEASQAGVTIDLIVRGACALRPGIEGLSDNISVRSVVGRFLEHSRIFYFYANGSMKMYLSSADWMDRNFFRRIELAFPVLDPRLKRRLLKEGLMPYLADNSQAWKMDADGRYRRKRSRKKGYSAQEALLAELALAAAPA